MHLVTNPENEVYLEAVTSVIQPLSRCSSLFSLVEHFVDKHIEDLIQRVSCVDPILDALWSKKILQAEEYDTIRALPTPQKKMRQLLTGPMKASRACKDELLSILRKQQPYLMKDLEGN